MKTKIRYIYFIDNYYACMEAADWKDAMDNLSLRGMYFRLVMVELSPKMARLADRAGQNLRRAIFEGARTPTEALKAIASFEDRGWIPKFN